LDPIEMDIDPEPDNEGTWAPARTSGRDAKRAK
jgi:hypothetical protein